MGKALAAWMIMASALAAPDLGPREAVEVTVDRVLEIVQNGSSASERRAQLRRVAGQLFDFEEMTRRALSRHWSGRTASEQAEAVGLFTDVLEGAYVNRIESYAGEKISYLNESIDAGFAVVKSRVTTKRRSEITVDYRLHIRDGRWRVYDVMIDGVSLVATYRSQFDRIIQAESYAVLMEKLRRKRVDTSLGKRL